MPSEKTVTKCSETRRSTKPIMEKRRRARINNSLSELKNLILDALKKDNARHSKLEKADILEMTVKHLQNLQMQQQQQQLTPDPAMMAKFRAGFAECANEVNRFMGGMDGVDPTVRQRLLNHLANCLTGMNNPPPTPLPPVHVQVSSSDAQDATRVLGGVHLVPTRLPSGDIAFLLPAVYAPSTVPISPASSTSSISSSPLSAPSPVNVLGSSGILSPAASDRSSPSPVLHHHAARMHQDVVAPSHSPVSVISHTSVPVVSRGSPVHMMSHSPVSMTTGCPTSPQSKAVWRPF